MPTRIGGWKATAASILAGLATTVMWTGANAQTLDRIRGTAKLKLAYDPDARPFSFKSDQGTPDGYAIALCNKIADDVKAALDLKQLDVEWIPLAADARIRAVKDGAADLVCGAEPVTLSRRKEVSFSIPIFPSGTGALLNSSAPLALREVLEYGQPSARPVWRGSPARTILENKTFSSVAGTTSEQWLADRIKTFDLAATISPVSDYNQGIERVLDGSTSVFFGDMSLLMDAASRAEHSGNLILLKRYFTYQPLGLELSRNDEDFRLTVDRALSEMYASKDFRAFFTTWFGPPDEATVTFFRQTVLPE